MKEQTEYLVVRLDDDKPSVWTETNLSWEATNSAIRCANEHRQTVAVYRSGHAFRCYIQIGERKMSVIGNQLESDMTNRLAEAMAADNSRTIVWSEEDIIDYLMGDVPQVAIEDLGVAHCRAIARRVAGRAL